MTNLHKRIMLIILPFVLFTFEVNSQIVVSTTFPTTQEMNEEEKLLGLIYSKSTLKFFVSTSSYTIIPGCT